MVCRIRMRIFRRRSVPDAALYAIILSISSVPGSVLYGIHLRKSRKELLSGSGKTDEQVF
jgi:hypothetical protein